MAEEPRVPLSKLLDAGYSPATIASSLDLPLELVMQYAGHRGDIEVADDDALVTAARQLVWRTVDEAFHILDEGTMANRVTLIGKVAGPLFRMMENAGSGDLDDLREDMKALREAVASGQVPAPRAEADDRVQDGPAPAGTELGSG